MQVEVQSAVPPFFGFAFFFAPAPGTPGDMQEIVVLRDIPVWGYLNDISDAVVTWIG